jgi:hypothetical protein
MAQVQQNMWVTNDCDAPIVGPFGEASPESAQVELTNPEKSLVATIRRV